MSKKFLFDFGMFLNCVSPILVSCINKYISDIIKQIETFKWNKSIIFCIFLVCWIFSYRLKKFRFGFVFVSALRNICYLSKKKGSSLRNVSFPVIKKTPLWMRFSIGINLDWTNINMKAIKGAYDSQNSFLAFKQVIKEFRDKTLFCSPYTDFIKKASFRKIGFSQAY